jgi:bacteriorhodopsin
MKLSLTLLALVAAADVADTGYDQAPEATYEPEQEPQYAEYFTASLDANAFHCRAPCPEHSPCLNQETGVCGTKIEPYGAKDAKPTCPEGTEHSDNLLVNNTWPFWVGFALLFIPALFFLCVSIGDVLDDGLLNNASNGKQNLNQDVELHRLVAGFILLVASLAYFTMATGNGYITRCGDGRSFYYARYIDWIITTPLILFELFHLAEMAVKAAYKENHADAVKIYGKVEAAALAGLGLQKTYIIFLDILMIVAGLIASLTTSNMKWVFFAFSFVVFLPVIKTICDWDTHSKFKALKTGTLTPLSALYQKLSTLTALAWFLYPIVWILAEGTGALSSTGEAIFYMILDVIAKSGFAVIIYRSLQK